MSILRTLCRCPVLVTPSGHRCMYFRFHLGYHAWSNEGGACFLGSGGTHDEEAAKA